MKRYNPFIIIRGFKFVVTKMDETKVDDAFIREKSTIFVTFYCFY